ncbi:MAG: radical SAM protein [Gammaproteobacteria bacterium]
MKLSMFNVVVDQTDDYVLLYNSFSGAIVKISISLYEAMKKPFIEVLPVSLIGHLKDKGILVDASINELERYEILHKEWKTGKKVVNFNVLLTYDCNFACPYCYQGRGEEGRKIHNFSYMDDVTYKATVQFIKNTTKERNSEVLELVLYGGEPFLLPEKCKELADEIANWCYENGVKFRLHALSNGSLLNQEIVNWLSKYECRLQIPIDGSKAMHDKYRFYVKDRAGSYEDIMKVLALTKGTGIETHIRISLTEETAPTILDLLDDLVRRGFTHVYPDFCYITAFTEACQNFGQVCLSDNKLFRILPTLWREAHKRGFPLDHVKPAVQPLPCSSVADGSYIIDTFGNVYKCWELVGLKEHCVGVLDSNGNLEKTTCYEDILNRNPVHIEQCRKHNYLPTCGGGCVCKAYWNKKTYHASGCGTDSYLLKDKVRVQAEINGTLVGYKQDDFTLEIMQDKQEPSIRHCYVLV